MSLPTREVIPFFRPGTSLSLAGTSQYFVDSTLIPPSFIGGDLTAPLKNNAKFDLIALSLPLDQLIAGTYDPTIALDNHLSIKAYYVMLRGFVDGVENTEVFKVLAPPALPETVGYARKVVIDTLFHFRLDVKSLTFQGKRSVLLAKTSSGAGFEFTTIVKGSVGIDTGTTLIVFSQPRLTNLDQFTTAGLEQHIEVLGYDLDAYFTK